MAKLNRSFREIEKAPRIWSDPFTLDPENMDFFKGRCMDSVYRINAGGNKLWGMI